MIGKWWCQEHGACPDTYIWIYYQGPEHQGNSYDRHMVLKNTASVQYVLAQLHGMNDTWYANRWDWPAPPAPPKLHHKKKLYKIWRAKYE